jgi:predicted DNA-binding transcriptional regulator AlpA
MDQIRNRLLPIPEAREILGGIGHTTIYQLIKNGEIIKVNLGRRGFVTSESIEAFLVRLTEGSEAGGSA